MHIFDDFSQAVSLYLHAHHHLNMIKLDARINVESQLTLKDKFIRKVICFSRPMSRYIVACIVLAAYSHDCC